MATVPVRMHEADARTLRKIRLAADERGVKISIPDLIHRAVALLNYEELLRPVGNERND